ncbi:LysR substrate-binding domain-containing protein [Limnohabitans sp.]|jgi:DNA-binding transcriptional LysR family regulator|uniref:LysR substrate-binding domain-containing protein n=1 Tax=Limnohabitans sp. TaxID=1907725 RepID=UPI0025C1B4D5|nr:LysR substrate-binding domain-containing protein [Limnohabitans sp.]
MIPPLTALQAFETIARRKSFSLAAEELHLTPSAVSHQVAKLESLLNVRLFERSARGVELTPAGQQYLQRVASALGAINTATEDLRHGVQDTLYVHSSPSFASLWLMPRIARFTALHPNISLMLSASHVHSDFQLGQMDIDIRYGMPNWPHLEVEPVFTEKILPLASPEFIRTHALHTPHDLLRVPLIQSSVSVVQWPEWFARFCADERPERMGLRFDRAMMSLDAAVQKLGVALESTSIGQSLIASGKLQPVFEEEMCMPVRAHFMVYPARHASRPEVKSFMTWLREEAQPTRA